MRASPPARRSAGPGRARRAVTGMLAAASAGVLAAGCSSEPAPTTPPTSALTSTPERAPIVTNTVEPAQHLLPADVGDAAGERVASLLFRGLVRYDAKGKLENEVAESVESVGDVFFRVKLRKGWVFGNGEPVTAASFVNAWNWAANPAHRQLRADAFSPLVGYASLRRVTEPLPTPLPATATALATAPASDETSAAPTRPQASRPTPSGATETGAPPGAPPPTAAPDLNPDPAAQAAAGRMAGLRVVDDLVFTIRLVRPDPVFRDRLAGLPYVPLPSATLADPERYAASPVGNGPYQLASGGWVSRKEIRLIPNASYRGSDAARNSGVTFRMFTDPALTYPLLLAGRLDVIDEVPLPALSRARADLGFRTTNQPVGRVQTLVFPVDRPQWASVDAHRLRVAISRSIDRRALAGTLFQGTRAPAADLASPVVAGYLPDLCGALCSHDADAARAEFAQLATTQPALQIAYGADAGGGPTVQALCGAITDTLGVGCVGRPYASQAALDRAIATRALDIPALATWTMDRPDLGGFMTPRFVAGSSRNASGYAGTTAQSQLVSATAASSPDGRTSAYQDAERTVLADLPEIPLWSLNATVSRSDRVGEVRTDVFGVPIYTEIERP